MAKNYKVIITPYAQGKLENITTYLLENVSYNTANKVLNGILDTIDSLEKSPHAHSKEQNISSEKQIFRRILKWSYKIIYTIKEKEVEVVIVEIMHTKQNPQSLINKFK